MAQQQLAERTMVTATLDADPVMADAGWGEFSYIAPSTTSATWQFRGVEHHGDVQITGSESQATKCRCGSTAQAL